MRLSRLLAFGVVTSFLLAACGGGGPPEEPGGSGGETSTEGLRVAYASDLDPNDVADQFGLQEAGAEVLELNEDSAVIAGLIRNDVDVGNIGLTEAIKAAQTGVPIKIFYVAQQRFEFVMVSRAGIKSFDQLAVQRVAYYAPGAGTEILQRVLVRQHDPSLEKAIKWVVLPESPNRAAAMLAGEIDVTSLEFPDVLTLQEKGGFNIMGTWGDIEGPSRDAISTVWVASEDFYQQNKERLEALAVQLQKGYNTFYQSKDRWIEFASGVVDVDESRLSKSYDFYDSEKMYPLSGKPPLTPELWKKMDSFFRQIGEYEDPASDEIVDYDIIKSANQESGTV